MKDFLTSIARTHLALIASTALVLALAVVPDESRSLDAGEAEANALEEVTRDLRAIEEAEPKGSFENADDTARIQRIA